MRLIIRGPSTYKFEREAPEVIPTYAPYTPTYDPTEGLIKRPKYNRAHILVSAAAMEVGPSVPCLRATSGANRGPNRPSTSSTMVALRTCYIARRLCNKLTGMTGYSRRVTGQSVSL